MKMIDIPEDCFAGFEDSHQLLSFEVDSSIDAIHVNLYLGMLGDKDNQLHKYQFAVLVDLLNEAAYYDHDVNKLLKIAYCCGNRQVIYEYHLRPPCD